MTANPKRSLNIIDVKSPCEESWAEMQFVGPAKRNCELCDQHVYDLSEMTQAEAEALVFESTGRVCVRFSRRMDGTVVTSDCSPVRFRHLRRAGQSGLQLAGKLIGAVVAVLAMLGFARFVGFRPFGVTQGDIAPPLNAQAPVAPVETPVLEPFEVEELMGELVEHQQEEQTPNDEARPPVPGQ